MLIGWFIILLSLSLILTIVSYGFKMPPLAIAGFTLLFLLGNVVLFSNLEIQSGYTQTEYAPCNNNCTEVREGGDVYLAEVTTIAVNYTYTPIPDEQVVGVGLNHLLGFFLALIGVLGFIDVIISLRGLK